ncbi:MAG: hypothetical protein ACI9KE_001326 [Polyangiales bacterium]|jgi:hypothetical protein
MAQNKTDWSTWNSSLLAPRIICFALTMSCVLYAGIMLGGLVGAEATGPVSVVAYIIPGMGLLMLPASFLLPRLLPFPNLTSPTKEVDGVFGKETVLADPADARAKYFGAAFTGFIIRAALSESIAIFGFVGFVALGTPLPISVGLCGVAALAILTTFPRTTDWKLRAETKLGARFPEE